MDCKKDRNLKVCNCTYPCSTKGVCCDCLMSHIKKRELPACCFDKKSEATYDRSFEHFAQLVKDGRV